MHKEYTKKAKKALELTSKLSVMMHHNLRRDGTSSCGTVKRGNRCGSLRADGCGDRGRTAAGID